MKTKTKILFASICIATLAAFIGCGSSDSSIDTSGVSHSHSSQYDLMAEEWASTVSNGTLIDEINQMPCEELKSKRKSNVKNLLVAASGLFIPGLPQLVNENYKSAAAYGALGFGSLYAFSKLQKHSFGRYTVALLAGPFLLVRLLSPVQYLIHSRKKDSDSNEMQPIADLDWQSHLKAPFKGKNLGDHAVLMTFPLVGAFIAHQMQHRKELKLDKMKQSFVSTFKGKHRNAKIFMFSLSVIALSYIAAIGEELLFRSEVQLSLEETALISKATRVRNCLRDSENPPRFLNPKDAKEAQMVATLGQIGLFVLGHADALSSARRFAELTTLGTLTSHLANKSEKEGEEKNLEESIFVHFWWDVFSLVYRFVD